MALNANESKNAAGGGGAPPPLDPGSYPARLVIVADLGLQEQRPYQGQEKPPAYEILTTYELLDEFMQDEDGEDILDKPRWFSESFPLYSLGSERAKSTKRYLSLDAESVYEGDWSSLVGSPCILTLVNNPGKGKNVGKVFTNIAGVSTMRPKEVAKAPALVNPEVMFDMDSPDMESFVALPEWIQTKIKGGLEYEGSKLADLVSDASMGELEEKVSEEEVDEDEVPY